MPTQKKEPKVYTARSQFWVGNTFFKPIDSGGRALDEGDPMLTTHHHMFEEYHPRTRDYGQPEVVRNTRIARIEGPAEELPVSVPHTHPHD